MMHVTLQPQHPSAVFDHTITVNGLAAGETLTGTPSVSAQTGLTVVSDPAPAISGGNKYVFWLSGGSNGRQYQGEVRSGTSASRTVVVTFSILIVDRSPNAS